MSSTPEVRRALVVYESMFHNTEKVADAIVRGLQRGGWTATGVDVRWASRVPDGVDLVVLGAPTHAFSLSRPNTRADAVRHGAAPARAEVGLREWLTTLPPATDESPVLAVFDTRVSKVRRVPASAARTIAKLAHRRGFKAHGRPKAFLVEDVSGPLCTGEFERATEWGRALSESFA
jgi:hypothetical protein